MIRARFKVNSVDFRPVVWPIEHPYWCTGYSGNHAILVAYFSDTEDIKKLWPDAEEIESETVTGYVFNERFSKPNWFIIQEETKRVKSAGQI